MVGSKEIILTYYSAQCFKLKDSAYWDKGNRNGLSGHYAQWMMLLNIRNTPDAITVQGVINCLKNDYGHLNENSITEAMKMNLRGEFKERLETYQLINENFLIKLLAQYNEKLLESHRIAVKLRDKALEVPEPTAEEIEAKNIKAMKSVFTEFKETGNENLISSLYYDFFNNRKMLNFDKADKLRFMEMAKVQLKEIKSGYEGMLTMAKIIKSIDEGGHKDEIITLAKKITVIEYFNSINELPI